MTIARFNDMTAQLPAPIELPDLRQAEDNLVKARQEETNSRAIADQKREATARADTAAQEAQRAAPRILSRPSFGRPPALAGYRAVTFARDHGETCAQ